MCKCVNVYIYIHMKSLTFDSWSLPMVISPLMSSTQFVFCHLPFFPLWWFPGWSFGWVSWSFRDEWTFSKFRMGSSDERCEVFHFGWLAFMGMGNPNIIMAYYISSPYNWVDWVVYSLIYSKQSEFWSLLMWFLLIWCLEKCLNLEHLDDMKRMNTTFTYLYWYTTIYLYGLLFYICRDSRMGLEWVIQSCLVAFGSWLIASSNFLSLFFLPSSKFIQESSLTFFLPRDECHSSRCL